MMRTAICAICLMVFATGAGGASPVEWSFAVGGNGHFYEVVLATNGITWSSAQAAAVAAGGYLATLTSPEENNFVYGLVSLNDALWYIDPWGHGIGPWLGGLQRPSAYEPNGGWQWVTDEPFTYTNWCTGEPNDAFGHEDRLCFFGLSALKGPNWNDFPGEVTDDPHGRRPRGYVIEFTPIPEPSTILALLFGLGGLVWRRRG